MKIFAFALVSWLAAAPAFAQSLPLQCRGGAMFSVGFQLFANGQTQLVVGFKPGARPAGQGLAAGECSWLDRGVRAEEPRNLCDDVRDVVLNSIGTQDASYSPGYLLLLQSASSKDAPYLDQVRDPNALFTVLVHRESDTCLKVDGMAPPPGQPAIEPLVTAPVPKPDLTLPTKPDMDSNKNVPAGGAAVPAETGGIEAVMRASDGLTTAIMAPAGRSDACQSGFVWRAARAEDLVCVTPTANKRIKQENAEASSHVDPAGAYGPNTCISGYVWREAFNGDAVCVTPEARDLARQENAEAGNHRTDANEIFDKFRDPR